MTNASLEIKDLQQAGVVLEQLELFFQSKLLTIRALRSEAQSTARVDTADYSGWSCHNAIRDFLYRSNVELTEESIAQGIVAAGYKSGENPLKNVRTSVSMKSDIFYRNNGHVGLVSWKNRQRIA